MVTQPKQYRLLKAIGWIALAVIVVWLLRPTVGRAMAGMNFNSIPDRLANFLAPAGPAATATPVVANANAANTAPTATPVSNVAAASSAPANAAEKWIPDNDQGECQFGMPTGTIIYRNGQDGKLTSCFSFNVFSGYTISVTWGYDQADLEFLTRNWAKPNYEPRHTGIGVWGPSDSTTTYVEVSYDNGQTWCKGTSMEVVPDKPILAKFVNNGQTPSVWSQGPWSEGNVSGVGIYAPACRAPAQ